MAVTLLHHISAKCLPSRSHTLPCNLRLLEAIKPPFSSHTRHLFSPPEKWISRTVYRRELLTTKTRPLFKYQDRCNQSAMFPKQFHTSSRNNAPFPVILLALIKKMNVLTVVAKSKFISQVIGALTKVVTPMLIKLTKHKAIKSAAAILSKYRQIWSAVLGRYLLRPLLKKHKDVVRWIVAGICLDTCFLYHYRFETIPETGRRRHIVHSNAKYAKCITEIEIAQELDELKDKILDPSDKLSQRIESITRRIIESNNHEEFLKSLDWVTTVLNTDIFNASANATGDILVHRGLIDSLETDGQLASVLAHEVAHLSRQHCVEKYSMYRYWDNQLRYVELFIWMGLSVLGATFVQIIVSIASPGVFELFIHMPYTRDMEIEADIIAIKYLAKAGYDVREASNSLRVMCWNELMTNEEERPELFSTHPSTEERIETIEELTPLAIELREAYGHPPLPEKDPRIFNRVQYAQVIKLVAERKRKLQDSDEHKEREQLAKYLEDKAGRVARQAMKERAKEVLQMEIKKVKDARELQKRATFEVHHIEKLKADMVSTAAKKPIVSEEHNGAVISSETGSVGHSGANKEKSDVPANPA